MLLKALQKTIIFEKDVTAALQREYGVIFFDPSAEDDAEKSPKSNPKKPAAAKGSTVTTGEDASNAGLQEDGRAPTDNVPVEPLLGLASSAFDKHMKPYIALEEKNMDDQLVSALEDRV